jgi:hypothetical protein
VQNDPNDMHVMQKISAVDQKQNNQDGAMVIAKTKV